jgi:hypothetical protein
MNQQNLPDDQNPYEYEEPVSTSKFRKYGSVATLGLLAIGTAFGGSALAANVMAAANNTSSAGNLAGGAGGLVEMVSPEPSVSLAPVLDANGAPIASAIQLVAGNTAIPAVQGSPSATATQLPTKAPIVALPVLTVVDYGNLSSATPYGSSASGGSTSASSWGDDDDDRDGDDDRDDDDDDRDGDDD